MIRLARMFIILLGILPLFSSAQQPAYEEPFGIFQDASELFDKEKYGAANQKFDQYLAETNHSSYTERQNTLRADAHFYRGLCNFHLLRDNAESQLRHFIDTYPVHARANEAWFYIGKLHFIKKDYDEALPALETLEFSPLEKKMRDEARFMLGYCHFKEGRKGEAAKLFDQARKGEGEYAENAAYYYAIIRYEQGKYSEALDGFNGIPEKSPFARNVPMLKANSLLKLGKYDELKSYVAEVEANDKKPPIDLFLIMGHAAYEQKDDAGVIENLELYEKKRGRLDRSGHYRLGISYYKQKDYKNAQDHLEKVSTPEDSIAQTSFYYLGHSFLALENYENARTAFGRASDMDFNKRIAEEALFQYAKASFETKYMEEALSALQKLTSNYPNSLYKDEANGLIGEILLFTNNYKDAIEYFETSGGLNTERARKSYQRACYLYGLELYEKRLYEKSMENFRTAFNQRKDPEITLMSYFWYAEALFRTADYQKAIEYYKTYLDQPYVNKNEFHAHAYYGIAWSNLELKNYNQASKNFEKFLALADKDVETTLITDASLRAADCEYVEGRYANARRYYTQVRDYNNSHVDYALYRLGQVYFRTGDNASAISNYQRLVNGYKKSEYRDDALNNLSDIYLTWEKDWPNTVKYALMLAKDHSGSPYVPKALNRAGIAQAESNNNTKAQDYFKTVVLEHCYDREAALDALRFLSTIISSRDYDRIYTQYKAKCPETNGGGGSEKEEQLLYSILEDRYFSENYESFLQQADNYFRDYPNGQYISKIYYWRGKVYQSQKEEDKALADFQIVYEADPVNEYTMDALFNAAEIQFARKNYLTALELYKGMEARADKLEDRLKAQFGMAESHYQMGNYESARGEYLAIFNDPNTTDYSRSRAHVQIGNCLYQLGRKDEAFEIFTKIEKDYENAFAAESQYWITKILYDRGEYEQSKTGVFYLKDKYPRQNYFKALAYMVLAEDYLALGDTFQAVEGTLQSLARQDRFPDIQEQALRRIQEIQLIKDAGKGTLPEGNDEMDDETDNEEGDQ